VSAEPAAVHPFDLVRLDGKVRMFKPDPLPADDLAA